MIFFRLLLFLFLFLHLSLHAEDKSLENVTLQLQWKHQFEFAGFYAAKEKGFYKDVGLDVEFIEYDNHQNISDQVIHGEAHYGLTYGSLVADYLNGKPVVLVANFFKQSPLVLVAQENIKSVNQLKGKRVMGSLDEITSLTLRIMLEKFNISIEDIENIPHTFNIEDFVSKNVDAMTAFTTNELYELNKRGIKYTVLDPTVYGTKYYDINLFTTKKEVQENPLRVQKFKEASIKGWEYALSHQDEIIQLILKKYNTQNKTKEALAFEAKQIEQLMLSNVYPIGSIDSFRIKTMADSFIQSGFIKDVKKSKNRDLSTFIFQDKDNPLHLTKKELAFIKNHPIIRVSNEDDWQPFDFSQNGRAKGYSVDIVKNLAKKIGVEIEFVNGYTWNELLKLFDNGKIDMLHVVRKNENRVKKYNYSKPYITWHGAYFINNDEQNIKSTKDFDTKKIGLIKGWETTKIFKEKFPKAFVVEYKNISDLLIALSLKEVDAIISMISAARYVMKQELITNVKLGGYVNVKDFIIDNKLYFASQKGKPEIVSIFNKTLTLLTIEEKNILYNKWFGNIEKKATVELTKDEQSYLKKKKEIKMCVDPDWMPFEKIEEGKHTGISADYMKLISSKIGIPITLIPTLTWSESILFAKEKRCDILPLAMKTPKRQEFMGFTKPYITVPLVIATDHEVHFISNISALQGKSIGLGKDYAPAAFLKNKYPKINFVDVSTAQEGLEQVNRGKIFGYIGNLTTISYQIQKYFPSEVKIAGKLEEELSLAIGVRNDEPLLLSILDKTIHTVDKQTKERILNHWISVKYEYGFDYTLFWYILTPFLLLAFTLLISYYILKKYNTKLKNEVAQQIEELRQKDEIILTRHRMAEMGEMLSMIAHQWKQPLGAISSAVMGIEVKMASGKFDMDNKKERELFLAFLARKHNNINEYVQYLSSTTDDFRNFFNPNKTKERVPLTAPIENALQIVQEMMQSNGIEIIKDFQVDIPILLHKNEVMQVLLNLLKNSKDNFLEKNISEPKVTISTFTRNAYYIISICDNGKGIPEEIIGNIFDPYFSTKEEKNGAGLGLYMSKTIIEEHHKGMLHVKNTKNGVCFEIIFSEEIIA